MSFQQIIDFWFKELSPKQWWIKDPEFDLLIKNRFLDIHTKANQSELFSWRTEPLGRLAEIIVLDQFSRNIFRDQPEAFASDPLALSLSQTAIQTGDDEKLSDSERSFLYMPFMHSESKLIHEEALSLFSNLGSLDFELKHKAIIDKYGRYPHRNETLGRESTSEEIEFLTKPGSSF